MSKTASYITRRRFLRQMALGSLTAPVLLQMLTDKLSAEDQAGRQSIIWLQGQTSGIHRSSIFALSGFPEFINRFFSVIPVDQLDISRLKVDFSNHPRSHILILDGHFTKDYDDLLHNFLKDVIVVARAVLLLGNEASYGSSVPEGFMDLESDLLHHVETPYFKLPGAPTHPRHLLGSLNHMLLYDLPDLDEFKRPKLFFSTLICDRCQFRGDFEMGRFVRNHGGGEGCLYLLGCKGPVTKNTCPVEKWNNSTSWCVAAGSPCLGCSNPDYPNHLGLGLYGQLSLSDTESKSSIIRHSEKIIGGALGLSLAGISLHAYLNRKIPRNKIEVTSKFTDEPK